MNRTAKSLVSLLVAVLMAASTGIVRADQYSDATKPTGEAIAGDIIIVRPISLAATLLGTVIFVASLPFSIPSGSVGSAAKSLIVEPAQYTFSRPLGQTQAKPIEDVQRQ